MPTVIVSLLAGSLFGAGLAISGMTNPARVRGFLDLFGNWDPTLVFVMGGAMLIMMLFWRVQAHMAKPVFGDKFVLPTAKDMDSRLIGGSALFGIGWGVAGLCPGPGFAALALAPVQAVIFLAGLLAGMGLFRLTLDR